MAKFRRLTTREGYENYPEWKKGYVFESVDFNGIEEIGLCYAVDNITGAIHLWECLENLIDA